MNCFIVFNFYTFSNCVLVDFEGLLGHVDLNLIPLSREYHHLLHQVDFLQEGMVDYQASADSDEFRLLLLEILEHLFHLGDARSQHDFPAIDGQYLRIIAVGLYHRYLLGINDGKLVTCVEK